MRCVCTLLPHWTALIQINRRAVLVWVWFSCYSNTSMRYQLSLHSIEIHELQNTWTPLNVWLEYVLLSLFFSLLIHAYRNKLRLLHLSTYKSFNVLVWVPIQTTQLEHKSRTEINGTVGLPAWIDVSSPCGLVTKKTENHNSANSKSHRAQSK